MAATVLRARARNSGSWMTCQPCQSLKVFAPLCSGFCLALFPSRLFHTVPRRLIKLQTHLPSYQCLLPASPTKTFSLVLTRKWASQFVYSGPDNPAWGGGGQNQSLCWVPQTISSFPRHSTKPQLSGPVCLDSVMS